jgi:TonB family protein
MVKRIIPIAFALLVGCALNSNRPQSKDQPPQIGSGGSTNTVTNFHSKTSPFNQYDKKIFKTIQTRWYALIDKLGLRTKGTVLVAFDLRNDGTVENLQVTTKLTDERFAAACIQAIRESAPFDPLPENLHKLVGDKPRKADFTFYY